MPDIQPLASRVQELAESLDRWKKAAIAALLLAVLAMAVAAGTAYLSFRKASQLATQQSSLAAAREERLSSELKDQGEKAAASEQRAAEAEQKAEALRLEIARTNQLTAESNLEISQIKIPRKLSSDQQKAILERLKPFAGTQFDMALNPDTETRDLLVQIEDTLAGSGWTETDWAGSAVNYGREKHRVAGIVSLTGVVIQIHPAQVAGLQPAADALAAALQAEGIFAVSQLGLGIKNDNAAALHVLVGMKPRT